MQTKPDESMLRGIRSILAPSYLSHGCGNLQVTKAKAGVTP